MTLFEFFIFGLHLAILITAIVGVQILDSMRPRYQTITTQESEEKFVESELEEPDSDDENPPFNPESETYTMTENPMLRHRIITESTTPAMEMVD